MERVVNIDWEFELEKAVGGANSRSHTEVIQLRAGDYTLSFISYIDERGVPSRHKLPDEWHSDGECSIVIGGKPIDLTNLGGGKVELHFPLGMHEHARKDGPNLSQP